MKIPTLVEILEAGVHFGHQKSRWHPKMREYIFTDRHGIHILDLERTRQELESVLASVKHMAAEGNVILFVTTKPQAREVVKNAAIDCGMPYLVDRWLGGMLTNFQEIKRLIDKYNKLKEEQATGELEKYTKKEQVDIAKKLEKMDIHLAGLSTVRAIPDALFIPAVQREKTAMMEANSTHVPVIGICDTNANPDKVEYVIPGNDDAVKSITLLVTLVAEAIKEGKALFEKQKGALNKKEDAPAVMSAE